MKWTAIPIKKLCVRTGKRDPRDNPDESFRYIDISSIDRERKIIAAPTDVLGSEAPSRARQEVFFDDVLVSTVRPNLNAVAMVPEELDGEIASTGFCVLRAEREKLHPRYLFYWTQTSRFIRHLTQRVRGANYPAVTDSIVKSSPIPYAPPTEQRRIVELLDQADALRQQRRAADALADRVLPALFYQMFGDPATNPFGFEVTTLAGAGAKVRYGLGTPPDKQENGVALIRATNISRGIISDVDMMHVDPNSVPEGKNAFLRAEEVIVVRSGAYTGDVAQVTEKWEGSIVGYDLVVSPGRDLIGEYVETSLLAPHVQEGYFRNHKTRAGQPHLNAKQLKETPFLKPPRELQKEFANRVRAIRKLRKQASRTKQELDDLFTLMLQRAFSGELTATWREAHMEELLQEMEVQAKHLGLPLPTETA